MGFPILLENGFAILQENGFPILLECEELNTAAEKRVESGNTVCDRSGRRVYPHELIKDPYSGNMVLKHHADPPQRAPRGRRRRYDQGSKRPEREDVFITTEVTVDDL